MTALEELIRVEIKSSGPMRFDRFMEQALYHPEHGYYTRVEGKPRTGRQGDFFTSVSVGPLFGRLLAAQLFQMWQRMDRPTDFWIIEQGANDGQLAVDILHWCGEGDAGFARSIRYGIVEPFPPTRARQMETLAKNVATHDVRWFDNLAALRAENIAGVFISNELVDAFPVRVVRFHEGKWLERFVTLDGEILNDIYQPILDPELNAATAPLPKIEGYTTEINLAARRWMSEVAASIQRGYIVTIDYGFPASLYYAPFRMAGTLSAYREHQRATDVLADPGEQDITAHVDFTALLRAGESAGWAALALIDQQRFLMGIAESELAGGLEKRLGITENLRAWNTLTHPSYLGSRFHALVQVKNAHGSLDCLRFARPGGWD